MKKIVPIKFQMLFGVVPILNFFIIFIWMYNCIIMKIKMKKILKILWIIIPVLLLFAIVMPLLEKWNNNIFSYIAFVVLSIIISYILIYHQKILLREENDK